MEIVIRKLFYYAFEDTRKFGCQTCFDIFHFVMHKSKLSELSQGSGSEYQITTECKKRLPAQVNNLTTTLNTIKSFLFFHNSLKILPSRCFQFSRIFSVEDIFPKDIFPKAIFHKTFQKVFSLHPICCSRSGWISILK